MAFAVEEGSDNELDQPQESTIKKKLFSITRDGTEAVINSVPLLQIENCGQIMNTYEMCKSELKNSIRGLFKQNLTLSSNLHYYIKN